MLVKISLWIVGISIATSIIVATSIRDNSIKVKFNCRELIGWSIDVPQEIIEECRKRNKTMSLITPGATA
jgi:hypothetical protein